jgi:dihydroorotate dehydrogenase
MLACMPRLSAPQARGLAVSLFGIEFPNPLGLAAGFDKNAEVPDAMLALGFGFVEIGSVTPKPQAGNPRPRLFRLAEDEAVINRMGFNNDGHEAVLHRLQRRTGGGIVGINLGANKDSEDRAGDYVKGMSVFGPVASYVTINISSPNTLGLRTLQSEAELRPLLLRVREARDRLPRRLPILLKLAPDLSEGDLQIIAACCSNAQVDGVILTNTTLQRPSLRSPHAGEAGGLSGAPLFDLSTQQLARFYMMSKGKIPLVGVGGIGSAEQAWRKITAGASLLQLYSALVYKGPGLIRDILSGLSMRLEKNGYSALQQAVGSAAASIAHQ